MNAEELLQVLADVAKDPKRAAEIFGQLKQSEDNLAEAQQLHREARNHRQAAEEFMGKAEYDRGQAEHRNRAAVVLEANIKNREAAVELRERGMAEREDAFRDRVKRFNDNHERLSAELAEREKAVAKEAAETKELMANYDAAKHKAALALAG